MKKRQEPTLLAELITAADVHTKLDNSCKKLLSHKLILAWILKYSVEEFAGHSAEAIAGRYILDDTIQVSQNSTHRPPRRSMYRNKKTDCISCEIVSSDAACDKQVTGSTPESKPLGRGKITYDLLFQVLLPGSKKNVSILINIEAQDNFYPKYPLLKRGIFYACRLIADQYGTVFTHTDYHKLRKVYSIWICTNPPKYRCGSITRYGFTEQNILGRVRELRRNYDLLSVLVICLNKSQVRASTDAETTSEKPEELIDMLTTLFSPVLTSEEKQNILESRFRLPMTTEIKEDMNHMCNISRSIKIEALKEGFYKGMDQGIAQGITQNCLENLRSLMKNLQLTAPQAMDALSIPQEERAQYLSRL